MRSFAIWYDKKNNANASSPDIQIHINLWEKNICGGKRGEVCLDFGLLVHDIEFVSCVKLYCPFDVKKEDIEDLGTRIHEHIGLVNAIFNEDYSPQKITPRYLRVQVPESRRNKLKDDFFIYQLDENNFSVPDEKNNKGTIISIDISDVFPTKNHDSYEKLKGVKRYYFRFRIFVSPHDIKMISRRPKNISPLQDAFIETQVIDFRLNNLRSCNASIGDTFAKGEHFNIKAIHYLVLRNISDEISYYGSSFSSRLLEDEMWSHYIEDLKKNIVAYHFKQTEVDEFVTLIRFEYKKYHLMLVLWYLFLVLWCDVLAGFCSNFLFNNCFHILNYCVSGFIFIILGLIFYTIISVGIFLFKEISEEGIKKWGSRIFKKITKHK